MNLLLVGTVAIDCGDFVVLTLTKMEIESSAFGECLNLSWRRPLSYRNQWTGFYMITVSVMKELILNIGIRVKCPYNVSKSK